MNDVELPLTEVTEPLPAVDFLAAHTDLSKSRIKDAMQKGAVWLEVNGRQRRLRRATATLSAGEKIALYYRQAIINAEPELPVLIADQDSCSVWIKPAGVLSAGSRFGDHCAIDRIVERLLDRPTFLVHRLDRFARGLMVLAHGRKAAANLSAQFEAREVTKVYQAIVHGVVTESTSITTPIDDRDAVSHMDPVRNNGLNSLVEIRIETGRKHQIRAHLASIGFPIVGDRQYGSPEDGQLQLAAVHLAFNHPTTGERCEYDLPVSSRPELQDAN